MYPQFEPQRFAGNWSSKPVPSYGSGLALTVDNLEASCPFACNGALGIYPRRKPMGVLDAIVSMAFRDEPAGRVVVFSGDRRKRGYVVRSEAEELKIKSFLKMFYFAHFYILILGMSLANAWSTFVIHMGRMGRPEGHVVRSMSIGVGVYCVVVGLPYVLLWRSYKKALPSFVSSQDEVVVSGQSKRQQQGKLVLVILGLALLIMGVGLVFLVRAK
jgi:hypothetical protein